MSSNTLSNTINKHPRESSLSPPPNKKIKTSSTTLTIPPDIVALIASFADNSTKGRLLRTSTANYDLVGPVLYERITISKENASQLFMGLPRSPSSHTRFPNHGQPFDLMELQWPDISMNFEDEGDKIPDGDSSSGYFPTYTTCKRKLDLLEHVKHIDIACIPDEKFSEDMRGWLKLLSRTKSDGVATLFTSVQSISFQSLSIYQLAVWSIEFVDFSYKQCHPFMDVLKRLPTCDNYCFTLPSLNVEDAKSFASSIGRNKNVRSIPSAALSTLIRSKFQALDAACQQIVSILMMPYGGNNITLHGFIDGQIYCGPATMKIFFRNCCCLESDRFKKTSCYVHQSRVTNILCRLSDTVSSKINRNTKSRLHRPVTGMYELISPSGGHLNMDKDPEIVWCDLKNEVLKTHPAWENVNSVMVDYKYAAPCVCCGTKDGR